MSDPADPLADWEFELPDDRIARHPLAERSASRLLVVPREGGGPIDRRFVDLPDLLRPGDLLVANDTRVMAARLRARRRTGGAVELLLLGPGPGAVPALVRPARRLGDGEVVDLLGGGTAVVRRATSPDGRAGEGTFTVELDRDPIDVMAEQGEMPLPPYFDREETPADRDRYQTVFAGPLGAAAAPTAGLHFTEGVLARLRERGVGWATVTLHVGIGTFRPLRPEDLERGELHEEGYVVPQGTVDAVEAARGAGGRVVTVGTTSARTLESASSTGRLVAGPGATRLFVRPGYRFRVVDALVTNFHLPRSSLLMLVAALVGRERLLDAYAHAVREGYRFYSYGDAMLVL